MIAKIIKRTTPTLIQMENMLFITESYHSWQRVSTSRKDNPKGTHPDERTNEEEDGEDYQRLNYPVDEFQNA